MKNAARFFYISTFCCSVIYCYGDEKLSKEEKEFAETSVKVEGQKFKGVPHALSVALDCKQVCDPNNPNYRCLVAGTLGTERDQELRSLTGRLMAQQPILITQTDLINIFHFQNAGYDKARGNTTVSSNLLQNSGQWSTISANTISGMSVIFFVPTNVKYLYTANANGFQLDQVASQNNFSLSFDDTVLQQTYGGPVSSVSVMPTYVVITTQNGCVAYDPTPQLANGKVALSFWKIVNRRIEAERLAGASAERIVRVKSAYLKVGLLSDDICNPKQNGGCGGCPDGQVPCMLPGGATTGCVSYDACENSGTPTCSNGN
jgi:hypothetical protein